MAARYTSRSSCRQNTSGRRKEARTISERGDKNVEGAPNSGCVLEFDKLQGMRRKEPETIVQELADERTLPAFLTILESSDVTDNMLELIMEILARCCGCHNQTLLSKILIELPNSKFILLHLKSYITRLSMPVNKDVKKRIVLENTLMVFSDILRKIPGAYETLPLGDLEQAADRLVKSGENVTEELLQNIEQLSNIRKEAVEKESRRMELERLQKSRRKKPESVDSVGPPPEHFREMNIIPNHDDIYSEKRPYLRRNVVKGAYDSLDHYLDVQFRLLKEDFIRPLREGIVDLVASGADEKQDIFKDIRVYKKVKILHAICSKSGIVHCIEFDNSRLKNVSWEDSKRLICGSLVCLSSDNFQTFIVATVTDRSVEEVKEGRVTLQFLDKKIRIPEITRFDGRNVYEMVETTAFFEAYSPVLKGIQQTTKANFPFQEYLVHCQTNIRPPNYLSEIDNNGRTFPCMDFSVLVREAIEFSKSGVVQAERLKCYRPRQFENVPVQELERWPSKELLGLDDSQYKALQIALTNEVAVIQGPPGTGKTYLASQITKLLLENRSRSLWKYTPILVICYTNHALDQFLEGIYKFHDEKDKIIRIGGQSKNEIIRDCSLKNAKQDTDSATDKTRKLKRSMFETHQSLEQIKCEVEESLKVIEKCSRQLLYENTLKNARTAGHEHVLSLLKPLKSTRNEYWKKGSVMLKWLGLVPGDVDLKILGEKMVIFSERLEFKGKDVVEFEDLVLGGKNFSLTVRIRTKSRGTIMCTKQACGQRSEDYKAVYIDSRGIVKFVNGHAVICKSHSRVNDGFKHSIGVVYSADSGRLELFVDGRGESSKLEVFLPEDIPGTKLAVGSPPLCNLKVQGHFVGTMKNFVYYRSARRDVMELKNNTSRRNKPDFDVIDPEAVIVDSSKEGWELAKGKRTVKKIKHEVRKNLEGVDVMTDAEIRRVSDIWDLEIRDRWRLYRSWVFDICNFHNNNVDCLNKRYIRETEELKRLREEVDFDFLQSVHVIGMTTTGAAKNRDLLHMLRPKITIVEEAAEVLESHIVTSLTKGCEHLILIGDHKQLRPKPTVFDLGLNYKLDVSLFERLIENGMPFACLRFQHRMSPDISVMMRHIYENFVDHDSVNDFEPISGIRKNIFFIDHREKENTLNENQSHSNVHEARFIGNLCKYLLQQGYSSSKITVLTPYTGQLRLLEKYVPSVAGLRICVVDNFQGEENDIILLSLVRSQDITSRERKNVRRLIGFLAIDNRICVSLSRAKKGFYCIGNLTLMRYANDLWAKILDDMEARGCVGKALPLACQNHPETITHVCQGPDFRMVPDGGCNLKCKARLPCGHSCEQYCHPTNQTHEETKCLKECVRKCLVGHPCKQLCYEVCKCEVMVTKTISLCGHNVMVPCHQDPNTVSCPISCQTMLKCGHVCTGTCNECKQGRLHVQCSFKCSNTLPCGHECQERCSQSCLPCQKQCPQRCSHRSCPEMCGEPCSPCKERCEWKCKHFECTKLCWELCDRPRCDEPCDRLQECDHPCPGLCGEPCPKKCLCCGDSEEVSPVFEDKEETLFIELADCGHVFEVKWMDIYIANCEKDLKTGRSKRVIRCPKCETPIWSTLRYGNIVKKVQKMINGEKKVARARQIPRSIFLDELRKEISCLENEYPSEIEKIKNKLTSSSLTRELLNTAENQVKFLTFMLKLKALAVQTRDEGNEVLQEDESRDPGRVIWDKEDCLERQFCFLSHWVTRSDSQGWYFTKQELDDFAEELLRTWILFCYQVMRFEIYVKGIHLSKAEQRHLDEVDANLASQRKLEKHQRDKCFRSLRRVVCGNTAFTWKYGKVGEEEARMLFQ